jgi:putative DNA primase/helicase
MGVDGIAYPPGKDKAFTPGDIVTIPQPNATVLRSKGVIRILPEPQPNPAPETATEPSAVDWSNPPKTTHVQTFDQQSSTPNQPIVKDELDEPEPRISIDAPGNLTEIGNSILFVNQYKDRCKFSFESKRWYVWDNAQRWKPNHIGKVTRWAKGTVKKLYGYAGNVTDNALRARILKHAERSNTRYGVTNLLDLARSDLECSELDFDRDGYLLNLKDCTLDLRTGEAREQSSSDMISKLAGVKYDPEAKCPKWEDHILKVFDGDAELIKNFQEICGYTLAGIGNPDAALFVPYGSGRNGKTVTLNVLTHIHGEYAVNIASQSLQPMKLGQIRSDLMPTKGARLITCTEPGKGMKIDDGILKAMTGGDLITARHLYGEPVDFRISGCLFLATNHKPRITDQTTGMWDRIWMIPFKHYFDPKSPDSDPDIEKKLIVEATGILNWCLVGWKRYQKTGKLVKCKAIQDETTEYQNSEDFLFEFLHQKNPATGEPVYRIEVHNKTLAIPANELYAAYKIWCNYVGTIRLMSPQYFGRELGSRFEKKHTMKGAVYLGICLSDTPVQTMIS